jgi:hypothetical protein
VTIWLCIHRLQLLSLSSLKSKAVLFLVSTGQCDYCYGVNSAGGWAS